MTIDVAAGTTLFRPEIRQEDAMRCDANTSDGIVRSRLPRGNRFPCSSLLQVATF
jgi:hypothetical protein